VSIPITKNSMYPFGSWAILTGFGLDGILPFEESLHISLMSSSYVPMSDHISYSSSLPGSGSGPFFHTCITASQNFPARALLSQTSSNPMGAYVGIGPAATASFYGVDAGQTVGGLVIWWMSGSTLATLSNPNIEAINVAVYVSSSDGNPINIEANGGDLHFEFPGLGGQNPPIDYLNPVGYPGGLFGIVDCS